MAQTAINQQLQDVYEDYLDHFYGQTWNGPISSPLLMHVFDEYTTVDQKIMFVGQETHSWGSAETKPTASTLQEGYRNFDLGKKANYGPIKGLRYLTSHFWNFSRNYYHRMNQKAAPKTNGFLWTNISKFDSGATTPSYELQKQNERGFELLKKELDITKPDVIVFLTGSKYDGWIDKLFSPAQEPLMSNGLLYKLSSADHCLPKIAFQTKHPRTLCFEKQYRNVLDEMEKVTRLSI